MLYCCVIETSSQYSVILSLAIASEIAAAGYAFVEVDDIVSSYGGYMYN